MNSEREMLYRIGIDVGGTNTDAVMMQGQKVLAETKQSTTADVTTGAIKAISAILDQSSITPADVEAVMVGTTHFINAFVQRKELQQVAIIRVGLPMTSGIPPLVDWPGDLIREIGDHIYMIGGGSYYTGVDYAPLDIAALEEAGREIKKVGLQSVAISAVFSPIRPDLEEEAARIVRDIAGDHLKIALSHQVGGLGLVERENAAIINASLQGQAEKVVRALEEALSTFNMTARLYFSRNDGTLMSTDVAREFPVNTCSSGPTNSIRGAAFLTGKKDAVVVDMGGTTTDVGVLSKGFARETFESFDIGGVRTNFTMPDVLSVGLGGGTIVRVNDTGEFSLGPDSVGFRLLQEAKVFGGDTLTATDIAVYRGQIDLGDKAQLGELGEALSNQISAAMNETVEMAVDQLKTSSASIPVILVGGGSILIKGDIAGASEVIRPEHGGVANAIGAAIGQVGGRVKRLVDFGQEGGREAAIERAIAEAKQNAVDAGALEETLEVLEIEEFPMPYMQTDTVDLFVRVAGNLDPTGRRK